MTRNEIEEILGEVSEAADLARDAYLNAHDATKTLERLERWLELTLEELDGTLPDAPSSTTPTGDPD